METVTISPKFQVVIPLKIRESMGLRSGEKAKVVSFRNRMEIIPMREIRSLRSYLKESIRRWIGMATAYEFARFLCSKEASFRIFRDWPFLRFVVA